MDPNTEIRKLRPAELYALARILASCDAWKTLMAVIPKEGTENVTKFNTEHFALIEQASCQQRKSGAEIFLEEWSTMGKRRPTLKTTLELLVKVQLFRAADYIAVDLLKTRPPERPASGPAAPVDISDEEIAKLMRRTTSESEIPDPCFFDSQESLDNALDEIAYPSQLSIERSLDHRELVEGASTLRISSEEMNRSNSNLMKFSKSNAESPRNDHQNSTLRNNSNLIQFSDNSIQNTNSTDLEGSFASANLALIKNFKDNPQAVLQRRIITATGSSNNDDEYSSDNVIREKVQVGNNSVTNRFSNSNSNNSSNKLELRSSELPEFVADIGRSPMSGRDELKSMELPQFVVEIARQRLNCSEAVANTKSLDESNISNDSNSSDTSSDSTDVATSSGNVKKSDIPIHVNFPSERLNNNGLVSAELPLFVADLGHR